jgi:seryl-tRNA synthetase|uniref:Serine--tRNA ligase n=1 Tax=candidate division WOR-3 bacterium TaxID=2052148 RepID=A0A7C6A8E5_UNCW3
MDLKFIRENPELVREIIRRRNEAVDLDKILNLDEKRRKLIKERDDMQCRQSQLTATIAEKKRNKQATEQEQKAAKELSLKIKRLAEELAVIEKEIDDLIQFVPNVIHQTVSDQDQIVEQWGEIPKFDFQPLPHWELAQALGLVDFKVAAKLAGTRFVLFKGKGALLERALINFCLDYHTKNHGYEEISPPVLNLPVCFYNSGALPKLALEMYQFKDDPFYLIPTAEVPLVNIHRDEILAETDLPKRYVAYTPCFRREAGSYGKDVRGMIRIHQFDKVELVKITKPEESYQEFELMRQDACRIMQLLKIPYRVKLLAAKEMAFQSAKTYDIDAWAAGVGDWLEVSSISNCEDFQTRRANIKIRRKNGKLEYAHAMNGSGLAFARIFIALVENNQQRDGSIIIPEVLRPYLGLDRIA